MASTSLNIFIAGAGNGYNAAQFDAAMKTLEQVRAWVRQQPNLVLSENAPDRLREPDDDIREERQ